VAHLKKLTFSEEELTLDIGKSRQLSVNLSPSNITEEPQLQYKSSAPKIVSVDQNGKVTAHSEGSAQITVSAGEISAECTVSVNIPLEGISVSNKQMQLQKGTPAKLETELLPKNTTETPQITYASSNPAVAAVDETGTITAVGAGTAVIYANAGTFSDSCNVQVVVPLQSVSLDKTDVSMWTGETTTLGVTYNPGDTTDDRTVQWSSSNAAVASVDGGMVRAVSDGTCTITATAAGTSASCIVRVSTYYHVTGVSLSETQITLDTVGGTRQLTAGIAPANATNPAVTYTSSNAKVASVSSTGLVTAVSGGTAVITATADGVTSSCTVTVNLPQAQKVIVLDPGHGGVDPGADYYGLVEKALSLKVGLYCKAYLEEHYTGAVVLMTRTTDTQLTRDETGTDLRARCQYAASVGADVMVSLHFNSVASHTSQGALVLISKQPGVTNASAALANNILAQLQALGIANRGPLMTASDTLFDANGAMDYYAINRICASYGIPGIIVEHCFVDNASDKNFCDSDEDLQRLGMADAIGIANYLGLQAK
jgi:N-acetylmuramoyl-L-alanine amidase